MIRKITVLGCALLLAAQLAIADEGFDDIFSQDAPEAELRSPNASISGELSLDLAYYLDDGWNSEVNVSPSALLTISAASQFLEGALVLELDANESGETAALSDVIDELYLKAYFPFGYLTAGLLKVEWGKGDGVHVIDPLNPFVQTGRVETDLFRMKRAEAMVMMSVYLGENGLLETVYKPHFHPHETAVAGRWSAGAPDVEPPDTDSLEYGRGAARLTATFGSFDLGVLYYYGFLHEPGYKIETVFTGTNPFDPTHYQVVYTMVPTRAHLAGFEGATALGPFTFRAEMGYWLTEDRDGDRPELYNDRFVYLGGIDILVPGTSIFASVQVTGAYVSDFPDGPDTDVDRLASSDPHTTTIIGAVEIPFARDTMKIGLNGLYEVEEEGYMIIPEYRWNVVDDLEILLSAQIFGGSEIEESLYYQWDENDNIRIMAKYMF